MKPGDTILILPSHALNNMHMEGLAGKEAKIIEVVSTGERIHGCWVKLPKAFMEEDEWFIPYNSIA